MKNVWKVWMDEYRAIFTDAGVALIFFGAIVIYPFFYSLPYLPEVLRDIPVAVVDGDHSALSRKLIRMLDAHENLAVAARFGDLESAKKAFFQREAHGIIVIPAGFEKKALRREQATVVLYGDASYFLTTGRRCSAARRWSARFPPAWTSGGCRPKGQPRLRPWRCARPSRGPLIRCSIPRAATPRSSSSFLWWP
jgi:ABC-2 type transport system permease protein